LGETLKFRTKQDWYKVTWEDICKNGGAGLMTKFANSPLQALRHIYPQHEWLPWKFSKSSRHFWDSNNNQKFFLNWLGKELHINEMDDWYRVSHVAIKRMAPLTSIILSGGLMQILVKSYPEHHWNIQKFCGNKMLSPTKYLIDGSR
jgi:hypothetical protein